MPISSQAGAPTALKVLMIYQDAALPSSRIRIIQLAPYLEKLGIQCTLMPYTRWTCLKARHYDAVILQKKLLSFWDYCLWKRVKTPIYFDFDDAIFLRDTPKAGSYHSATRRRRFKRMLRLVNHVVAGNEYLTGHCAATHASVHIIPSPVPHNVPQRQHEQPNTYPIKLGWLGTAGNLHMLQAILPQLEKVYPHTPFELHIMSDQPFAPARPTDDRETFNIINTAWSLTSQDDWLATLDVGLMPMANTPWTQGKCAYKLLQYMAANVVAVGSSVGMNQSLISEGVNGFLVDDDWARQLVHVLKQNEAFHRIGKAGRTTVEQHYTYEAIAANWSSLLQSTRT